MPNAINIKTECLSKFYKDLTIDEKINAKTWGFWRQPTTFSKYGFMCCMIDNALSFHRYDYAIFTKHHVISDYCAAMPRPRHKSIIYLISQSK